MEWNFICESQWGKKGSKERRGLSYRIDNDGVSFPFFSLCAIFSPSPSMHACKRKLEWYSSWRENGRLSGCKKDFFSSGKNCTVGLYWAERAPNHFSDRGRLAPLLRRAKPIQHLRFNSSDAKTFWRWWLLLLVLYFFSHSSSYINSVNPNCNPCFFFFPSFAFWVRWKWEIRSREGSEFLGITLVANTFEKKRIV